MISPTSIVLNIKPRLKQKLLILIIFLFTNVCSLYGQKFSLTKINDNVWIHISYKDYNGYNISSNGLVLAADSSVILIDTPFDDKQTEELLSLIAKDLQKPVVLCIGTHAHDDRIGGVKTLIEKDIRLAATPLTAQLAVKNGFLRPDGYLPDDTTFNIDGLEIQTFYPGKGHTEDNIVVWIPKYKILFGGCLVKSLTAKDLGNISEAHLTEWKPSVQKILNRFSDAEIVIPGHGTFGDKNLLLHTIELLDKK